MKKLLLSSACFLLVIGFLKAQPANDNPCGAISLNVTETADGCTGNFYNVSTATYLPLTLPSSCVPAGNTNPDIWFKFTPTVNAPLSIFYTSGYSSSVNLTYIELYSAAACNGPYTLVDCWAISNAQATQGFPLTSSGNIYLFSNYYIRLVRGASTDSIQLCLTTGLPSLSSRVGINTKKPGLGFDVAGMARFRDPVLFGATVDFNPSSPYYNYAIQVAASNRPVRIEGLPSNGSGAALSIGGFGEIQVDKPSVVGGRFIINSNGYVGVNNALPAANLDVAGTFKLNDGTQGNGKILTSDFFGNATWQTLPATANTWSINGTNIYNSNAGNVGIGISSPGFPLNFASSTGDKISLYGSTAGAPYYGLGIQSGLLQIHADVATSNIAFGYGTSSSFTERMRIINSGADGMTLIGRVHLKNGTADISKGGGVMLYKADNTSLLGFMGTQNNQNIGFYGGPAGWGFVYDAINSRVGIGTENPTSLLNVNGQLTIDQKNFGGFGGLLVKGNTPGSNYPNIAFSIKNNAATPTDIVAALIEGTLVNNTAGSETIDLTFNTSQSGQGGIAERMRIKGNGFVGIGNNNPTRPLSFPSTGGEKILLYPGINGEAGIGVYNNELRIHADNAGAKVSFGTQDNAGNFDQTALAQRNGVYAFSVIGSIWVNGTTYASDQRFKQNISAITSPLQKLMQINGVEYEMKTAEFETFHFQPGRQMGLLAQNVETVVPEAVNEKDGYKGVDYARLVPLLIESIKELNKKIELLESRIK